MRSVVFSRKGFPRKNLCSCSLFDLLLLRDFLTSGIRAEGFWRSAAREIFRCAPGQHGAVQIGSRAAAVWRHHAASPRWIHGLWFVRSDRDRSFSLTSRAPPLEIHPLDLDSSHRARRVAEIASITLPFRLWASFFKSLSSGTNSSSLASYAD